MHPAHCNAARHEYQAPLFGHNSPSELTDAAIVTPPEDALLARVPRRDTMRNSAIARLVVMSVLTVALLIPLTWAYTTVSERASRRDAAVAEVSATWGGPQVIGGPVLDVPYSLTSVDSAGRQQRYVCHAYVLPHDLQIEATLGPETRSRGIFDVIVYRSTLKVTGRFVRPDLSWVRPVPDRIEWDQAAVHVGVADPRGLTRRAVMTWRGRPLPFSGGTPEVGLFHSGIHASAVAIAEASAAAIARTMQFNSAAIAACSEAASMLLRPSQRMQPRAAPDRLQSTRRRRSLSQRAAR